VQLQTASNLRGFSAARFISLPDQPDERLTKGNRNEERGFEQKVAKEAKTEGAGSRHR
jgi:hypothetical protein